MREEIDSFQSRSRWDLDSVKLRSADARDTLNRVSLRTRDPREYIKYDDATERKP